MIEVNEIFSDKDKRLALWCEKVADTNELAVLANKIAESGVGLISVPSEMVADIWTYLEKLKIDIFTRYSFLPLQKNNDVEMNDLVKNISRVCRQGATGVQIFVKMRDFERFIDSLMIVRNDLFFNHTLSICMDVNDIDINNLGLIFQKLKDIHADSFGLTFNEDMGNRSDFIGRIYALFEKWDFDGDLHFILVDNLDRVDQTVRLAEILQPNLIEKTKYFF